jgi:hypothetical protein
MASQIASPLTAEGVYVLQTEEVELGLSELSKFAEILRREMGITPIEATAQLKRAFGILRMPDPALAEKVSAALTAGGIKTKVFRRLLLLPELLPREADSSGFQPELIAAGILLEETSKAIRQRFRPSARVSMVRESTTTATELTFVIDAMNQTGRARREEGGLSDPLKKWLAGVVESAGQTPGGPYLSSGVKLLLEGRRNLPRFQSEVNYERYLTRLFNLRYAPAGS